MVCRGHRSRRRITGPHELVIAQLPPDEGFYLLYLDGEGNEITDTYHDSLDKAVDQAKWEIGVDTDEWQDKGSA